MKKEAAVAVMLVGYVLLVCFVYVQVYNYLYEKYGNRIRNGMPLFDTTTSRETFKSMLDMGLMLVFVIGVFRGGRYAAKNVNKKG